MTTINLKDFYYWYTQDQFIEVSDEVAEVFLADGRHEMAYQRRLSRLGTLCLEVRITKNARMTQSHADARSNIFIYVLPNCIFTTRQKLLVILRQSNRAMSINLSKY